VTVYSVFKITLSKMYGSMNQIYLQRTLPFSFFRKNTDITFFFGRMNCYVMESVLLSMEHLKAL